MTPIKDHIHDLHHSEKDRSVLRNYQLQGKTDIYSAWNETNNIMFQMPTGTGKTVLFASIINELDMWFRTRGDRPLKILIIAHRNELIEQIGWHLSKRCIHFGIIKGGVKPDFSQPVQIGSIQTVTHKAREEKIRSLDFDYIIIDEAHHSAATTYRKLWDYFPNSKKLGVTATPCRLDGQGFTDLFDKLITTPAVKQFIKEGWLAPYTYYSIPGSSLIHSRLQGIKIKAGDYDEADLARHFDTGRIRAQLYMSYEKYVSGKKGIIYAINVEHAEHICQEYSQKGVRIVRIDSGTPACQRREMVSDFRNGKIDVIVNVNIFSEGFDCPDIEFIQLARPTKSLAMYLQQVGRGLRITEDKSHCVILDNVGMYGNFGLPDAVRRWNYWFHGTGEDTTPVKGLGLGTRQYEGPDTSEGFEEMVAIVRADAPEPEVPADNEKNQTELPEPELDQEKEQEENKSNTTFELDGPEEMKSLFTHTSTSYKFFWMLALLDVARVPVYVNRSGIKVNDLIDLMISHAWNVVKVLKLNFCPSDRLPNIVKNLNGALNLPKGLSVSKLFSEVQSTWNRFGSLKQPLGDNVPYRFLAPWITYENDRQVIEQSEKVNCPYRIIKQDGNYRIAFNPGWQDLFLANSKVYKNFVYLELSSYLAKYNDFSAEEIFMKFLQQ